MTALRIPVSSVAPVARAIFNKARFSGGEAARRIGVNQNTLWSWFFNRGVPIEEAFAIADIMTGWAVEMLALAGELRKLAQDRLGEERTRLEVISPIASPVKQNVGRPRRRKAAASE